MDSRRVPVSEGVFLRVLSLTTPSADDRPFLLVHGLSSNATLWERTMEILAESGHPCFAIDLRSHGLSDAPDTGYTTAVAADDVAAVAGRLGLAGALVAGQSWGGNVVVDLAARHPATVDGLALVDGGWFSPSAQFASRDQWRRAATPPDIDGRDADDIRGYMRGAHPGWSDRAIDSTMANLAIGDDGTVARRLSVVHHMQIAMDMWDSPPDREFPAVDVPVVLIPALPSDPADAKSRLARVEAAAAKFPDAVVRPHVGDHDLHAQQPEALAADLLELASRVEKEAAS